ncbi:MAG: aspartyl-tRNA(Asn)/glutamyl-tRNA (Gln) amidotransferase subunit B [bacterium]|nr:MAG: aspartyl-tRNA(Asn)/glutamyl-tRNA (Gln) amidotransferase subunit B [bacterium]
MRLKQLLVFLEVNDGNMEEGSLRCDANVSVRRNSDNPFGVKAEIKNLNSFKNVERGIRYEMERQARLIESGEKVVQESRMWDANRGITLSMRSKEDAHDYRYFPEPDAAGDGKLASNWVMTEVMRLLKDDGDGDPWGLAVKPSDLGRMLKLITAGTISGKIGKIIFEEMATGGGTPESIISARGLVQISDDPAIDALVEEVLSAHPGPVEEYLAGKEATFQFLTGQVMKVSKGRVNPGRLKERLQAALDRRRTG